MDDLKTSDVPPMVLTDDGDWDAAETHVHGLLDLAAERRVCPALGRIGAEHEMARLLSQRSGDASRCRLQLQARAGA